LTCGNSGCHRLAASERAYLPQISEQKPEALKRFRLAMNVNMVLGAVVLLLTSMAQAG